MASSIGNRVVVSLFGESHGKAIGVVMDGLPPGEAIDCEALGGFLLRRAPGRHAHASQRREGDTPQFLSGLYQGKTTGSPLCAVIENQDADPRDYAALCGVPRPGHADYPAFVRYAGHADMRGGGHLSGRLTAPLCIAGGIALQMLARRGMEVGAHIASIGGVEDTPFDPAATDRETLRAPAAKPFPVLDDAAGLRMMERIHAAVEEGDSVGGAVECMALGVPAGLGSPIFGNVESRICALLFGIPAVRGVSFGEGFEAAGMRGSEHNDGYVARGGKVLTQTNRHGGVLGGITTGMPLLLRTAFKPTPSIAKPQQTIRLDTLEAETIRISGRHDPCIVPRAVPCVEAAVALAMLDMFLEGGN